MNKKGLKVPKCERDFWPLVFYSYISYWIGGSGISKKKIIILKVEAAIHIFFAHAKYALKICIHVYCIYACSAWIKKIMSAECALKTFLRMLTVRKKEGVISSAECMCYHGCVCSTLRVMIDIEVLHLYMSVYKCFVLKLVVSVYKSLWCSCMCVLVLNLNLSQCCTYSFTCFCAAPERCVPTRAYAAHVCVYL
jgi:hypothetical protein